MPSTLFANEIFPLLSRWKEEHEDKLKTGFVGAIHLASLTIILTILLELFSIETVHSLHINQRDGPRLYRTAWIINFFNHFCLGPPVYVAATLLFTTSDENHGTVEALAREIAILAIHGICYHQVHKIMHLRPGWYKHHRFHHQFKEFIPPSSANAVSTVEYLLAYIMPFAIAAAIVRPTETELRVAVLLVSIPNLFIHTPALAQARIHPFFVSTAGHAKHHRELKVNYAAPIWNIDWCINVLQGEKTNQKQ